MDFTTFVNLAIAAAISLALLRWVLSIKKQLDISMEQRELLKQILVQLGGKIQKTPPQIIFPENPDAETNSKIATKLTELNKKWEAGEISAEDYKKQAEDY